MHAQPYSEAPANPGRGRGRTSGGKRPVAVQIVRDLLHSRSGSGSGCITDQNYFWIANRVYQSWLLRFSQIAIYTTLDDCAPSFELGQKYLVFAYYVKESNHLETETCMGTGRIEGVGKD